MTPAPTLILLLGRGGTSCAVLVVAAASGRLAALLVAAEAAPRWADSAPQCVVVAADDGDGITATRCESRVQPAHEDAALVLVDVVDLQVPYFALLNHCSALLLRTSLVMPAPLSRKGWKPQLSGPVLGPHQQPTTTLPFACGTSPEGWQLACFCIAVSSVVRCGLVVQVDSRAENGADDDGAEASLQLLPDPTQQERLFAAHPSGKLSVFGPLNNGRYNAMARPGALW